MKQNKHRKKKKTPWPTKAVMEQIYENKLWGGNNTDFYSGDGSHLPEMVDSYIIVVTQFLNSFEDKMVVCDLGCGDFNIGAKLYKSTKKYIGIDIVEPLIERNKQIFMSEKLTFQCLDISKDDLPKADCIILRQVLQHLSNKEVQHILSKLNKYKFILLTEHFPAYKFEANEDIISGQGIRLKKKSGLDILKPPFNFKVESAEKLLSLPVNNEQEIIETTLYTVF